MLVSASFDALGFSSLVSSYSMPKFLKSPLADRARGLHDENHTLCEGATASNVIFVQTTLYKHAFVIRDTLHSSEYVECVKCNNSVVLVLEK